MKKVTAIFDFILGFYLIKKKLINSSKDKIFSYCFNSIIEELKNENIYDDDNWFDIDYILNSSPFKNGVFEHFLKPNEYTINTTDIAVALNMGIRGYNFKSLNTTKLIDLSFYLTNRLLELSTQDRFFKLLLESINKDVKTIKKSDPQEIEQIFSSKKKIFQRYFNIFSTNYYSQKITVYHPSDETTWIDWKEENSLTVNIYEYDIPRGFFIIGFDYKTNNRWLKIANRTKEKEYFNPKNSSKSAETIWLQ